LLWQLLVCSCNNRRVTTHHTYSSAVSMQHGLRCIANHYRATNVPNGLLRGIRILIIFWQPPIKPNA
jgi:hypothetical protein